MLSVGWFSQWSSQDWTTATQHGRSDTGNCRTSTTTTELSLSLDFRAEHSWARHAMSGTVALARPVRWRVQFKLCCVMHSIFHGTCPAYLLNIVEPAGADRTRSRFQSTSSTDFSLPQLRTKFGERSFCHAGCAAWNDLPEDTAKFGKQLKTYCFTSAFNIEWLLDFAFLLCFTVLSDHSNAPTLYVQTVICTL